MDTFVPSLTAAKIAKRKKKKSHWEVTPKTSLAMYPAMASYPLQSGWSPGMAVLLVCVGPPKNERRSTGAARPRSFVSSGISTGRTQSITHLRVVVKVWPDHGVV